MTEQLIGKLGYLGIALILILGGLGLPIPEEAPIILAAVLSRNGKLTWPLALGKLSGRRPARRHGGLFPGVLLRREGAQPAADPPAAHPPARSPDQGIFSPPRVQDPGSGRFVPGFRTAAYLTAGILKLPPLKLLSTDLVAASLSTLFMFGLGYAFAYQIQKGIREVQQWVTVLVAVVVVVFAARSLLPGEEALGPAGRSTGSRQRRRSVVDRRPPDRPSAQPRAQRPRPHPNRYRPRADRGDRPSGTRTDAQLAGSGIRGAVKPPAEVRPRRGGLAAAGPRRPGRRRQEEIGVAGIVAGSLAVP